MESNNMRKNKKENLTVRLLETSTGTWTTEFLGFATTWVSDQKSTVISHQDILDFLLGGFINI